MSHDQPTVLSNPHNPKPSYQVNHRQVPPYRKVSTEIPKAIFQARVGFPSTCLQMSAVTSLFVLPPVTSGGLTDEVTCIVLYELSVNVTDLSEVINVWLNVYFFQ